MAKLAKRPAPKPSRAKPPKVAARKPAKSAPSKARGGATIRWNEQYETGAYKANWDISHPSQELVAVVAALGMVGAVALDVGCGAGTEVVFLAQAGFRAIGVDVAPAALAIAAQRARAAKVEVELLEGSALSLPLEGDSVDFVNDRGLLHHIPEGERSRYAREVARVLKPGGVLVLRGAREPDGAYVPVTPASLDRHFDRRYFRFGPILPIELDSDSGRLRANFVMLRRTADLFGTY
jgi:SAM-dependent methyltransferase